MAIFDLEEKQFDGWFDFDGGKVKIRLMTESGHKEILDIVTETKADYAKVDGKAERFEYDKVDEEQRNELFWDFVIEDWKDFLDKNKNEIPVTKENKLLLLKVSEPFAGFCIKTLDQLKEDKKKEAEATAKN